MAATLAPHILARVLRTLFCRCELGAGDEAHPLAATAELLRLRLVCAAWAVMVKAVLPPAAAASGPEIACAPEQDYPFALADDPEQDALFDWPVLAARSPALALARALEQDAEGRTTFSRWCCAGAPTVAARDLHAVLASVDALARRQLLETRDYACRTPLWHLVEEDEHRDYVAVMLAHGANTRAVDIRGRSVAYMAVVSCSTELVRLLLDAAPALPLRDWLVRRPVRQRRPQDWAATARVPGNRRYRGRWYATDHSPLEHACARGSNHVAVIILDALAVGVPDADERAQLLDGGGDGDSDYGLLHLVLHNMWHCEASVYGDDVIPLVRALVRSGVSTSRRDRKGRTPHDYARTRLGTCEGRARMGSNTGIDRLLKALALPK